VRWVAGAIVLALVAVVTVNALLLAYGGDRHDPVGRLSPITHLPAPTGTPRPLPPPAPTDD
jgi:hypothetical protein